MDKTIKKEGVEPRYYEIALLLPREELLPDILKILSQHKIEIKSEGSVKKIRLAYDIEKVKEAYFVFFHVEAMPEDIKLLEINLRGNTTILRFLVLALKTPKTTESGEAVHKPARISARRPAAAEPKALSNEALEKKIEEILQ